jgi:hypothetical protein
MAKNMATKLGIAVHDADLDWRVTLGLLADGISVS